MRARMPWAAVVLLVAGTGGLSPADDAPQGFVSLFNGKDFTGWKVPEGDNGHWKVVDGVIDYDAKSEAKGDKSLWSDKSYRDFVLKVDWRLKKEPGVKHEVDVIGPDGKPTGKKVEIDDV